MWKLAISELKLHPRRYVAVLLAIVLGTMFLAGSLLVTSSAKESTKQMLGATYANADLLITAETPPDPESDFYDLAGTAEQAGSLTEINGVEEVYPLMNAATAMVLPEGSDKQGTFDPDSDFVYATNRPADASLLATPMTDGELPTADNEITVDTESAERHDLAVGDTVTLRTLADEAEQDVTVSGIMDQSMDPTVVGAMTIYTTVETLGELGGDAPTYDMALLRVDGDIDQEVDLTGLAAITVVNGGYSAIAMLGIMLVINNTLSVLGAQRTRQYALQRVLGATRGQIRKGGLAESVLIGLIGSITGIALAIGLIFGLLALAQQWMSGATFGMDLSILWVLLAGVVITVAASWLPASQAMRVSPLEAMRPVPAATMGSKAGKLRLVLGSLMLLAGGAALVFFAAAGLVGMAIVAGAV